MAPSDTLTRVTSISIGHASTILAVGDSVALTAVARDHLENALTGRQLQWRSDYPERVSVSATGMVSAVSPGTTSIVVSAGRVEQRIAVTVTGPGEEIRVRPGDDLQTLVSRSPAGTTFRLMAGVYRRQSITPRDGMTFVGEPGTVLDGELITEFAFRADDGSNVTLKRLTIRRYAPPLQDGAVHAERGDGWVIDSCDIGENTTGGIRLGNRMHITRSRIHDNGQIGVLGSGDAVLVEDNEIARNNPRSQYDMYWEAGGTKFARTRDLVVRGNFVHHNLGPGLWTDIDNVRTLYENNRVEDNAEAGIFHEISYAAVIRNNVVRRNGAGAVPADGVTGAGILVSVSSDVEISGNTVEDNHNGIVGIQDDRGSGDFGRYVLQNMHVHDNAVVMRRGVTGIVSRGLRGLVDGATFGSRGNRFAGNRYAVDGIERPFIWKRALRSVSEWRSLTMDTAVSPGR